ncbi:MAG: M60 family metallopeptidase [Planctomycetia bacterium]|nr:M60 family metallopeptidase [Planctomycetia bacterium]
MKLFLRCFLGIWGIAVPLSCLFAAEIRVPAEAFSVRCDHFQPGTGIAQAFDGNPATIWHSRWNDAGNFPLRIEVTFRQKEKIDHIFYLPRQDGVNGIVQEYRLWGKNAPEDDWQLLHHSFLAPTATPKYLSLESQEYSALCLEILQGVGGFGSAAEIAFCRETPDKMEWAESTVIQVQQKSSVEEEVRRRWGGFPWSKYQPTGLSVAEGAKFSVFVEALPGDPLPELVIHDLQTYQWKNQSRLPLKRGENHFQAPRDGILYIDNGWEPPRQKQPPVLRFAQTDSHPFYQLGKTTLEAWKEMLEKPNSYGMAELAGDHVLMTFSTKNVVRYVDDPADLLKHYENLISLYARFSGFAEDDPESIHRQPQARIHLVEVDHGFMYATAYRTAYHFNALQPVLQSEAFLHDGWGPWHEIGHMHQVPGYQFQGMTEVTVNLFSLEMQTSLGQKARIDTESMHQKIRDYFQKPERNYHAEEDVFMKLAMFWQLRLAFGDTFYPRLHQDYREKQAGFADDDAKVQGFIVAASEISGWNLAPFFQAWGLPVTEETLQKIRLQKPLTIPIWENLDFSRVLPNGTLGIVIENGTCRTFRKERT